MKHSHARTVPKIIFHALAVVAGGFLGGWLLSFIGAKVGLASEPSGMRQLGYAVLGALVGLLIGLWSTAWGLGRALKLGGSGLGVFLGTVVGAIALFASLRLANGNGAGLIIGSLLVYACVLIGYYAPWRRG